jgi:hypothetical protein
MSLASGACLCGALRFHAPLPPLWVAHCHCTLCQKNAGSAFVTWAGFEEQAVQIDDSNNTLKWYSATEKAYRGFCSKCASTVFFKSARWPGELHITLVNFEHALDHPPQAHVYWESRQPWLEHMAAVPKSSL